MTLSLVVCDRNMTRCMTLCLVVCDRDMTHCMTLCLVVWDRDMTRYVNSKIKSHLVISKLKTPNGSFTSDNNDMANIFNCFFSSVYTSDNVGQRHDSLYDTVSCSV